MVKLKRTVKAPISYLGLVRFIYEAEKRVYKFTKADRLDERSR